MCGIVGYIGKQQACPIIMKGLKRLEYRGYDSAGVAFIHQGRVNVWKKSGKVATLEDAIAQQDTAGTIGIGHTRWATHGDPSDKNAHPHASADGRFVIIHNGIIENYATIKKELMGLGHTFSSDTDTEVLAKLIGEVCYNEKIDVGEAVRLSLKQVEGAYAIVVMDRENPNLLVCARKGSPMVIGIGHGEYFIASDATPIVEYTKNVIYLKDNEIAFIERDSFLVKHIFDNTEQYPFVEQLHFNLEMIEKGGFEHFMLKEIVEQPRSIKDCMRGRVYAMEGKIELGGLHEYVHKLKVAERIVIVACGTSWHAGLVAEYLIEEFARTSVEVEYASEFRYRNPILSEKDVVIAISQSGETADTLAALELAKQKGATVLGVCNVVGSSIPRLTDAGVYTHAGTEIGVASTKAFTAQVTVLMLIAFYLGQQKGVIKKSRMTELLTELEYMPSLVEKILQQKDHIQKIAHTFSHSSNCLFLGRGIGFPVALEGSLKLKEISYIHAEGYPAAEMKHGPIALIDENMPVVFIATRGSSYEKIVSNIQEVKARKGKIISITTEGDKTIAGLSDHTIEIPHAEECFLPLLATIPLQLMAYFIAVQRGCNVDQPRNLAKSVTVE